MSNPQGGPPVDYTIAVEYTFPLLNVLDRRSFLMFERCILIGRGIKTVGGTMDGLDEFRMSSDAELS